MSVEGVRFLQQVREAVADGNRLASPAASRPCAVTWAIKAPALDPVAHFRDAFTAAGGFVHVVADTVVASACC